MFLKVFLAICINIAFWEVFIRFFISSPCTQLADDEFGYMNIPDASFVYSSEGFSLGRFNSLGFNDDEPLQVVDELKRIFLVGDSYTESFQVPRQHSYVQLLERKLNDTQLEKQVDIIKIARDGFGPAHYPLVINRFMDTFQPDLIVLQFWAHSGGDLYAENIECKYDPSRHITSLQVKPQLEDKGKEELRLVINNSALMYHLLRRYKPVIMKLAKRFSLYGYKADSKETRQVQSRKANRTLLDMSQRIAYILDKIMANGSDVIVFYIPAPGIFFDDTVPLASDTLEALRVATAALHISFIDLTDNFKNYYIHHQPVNGFINTLPGKGHLNSIGHSLVATALAQKINHQQVIK